MGWLEAKHRRSEEKAERLQLEELEKILAYRNAMYERVVNLTYDKYGVSNDELELPYLYLSDDIGYSDYGTDTYRLAKESVLYGRVVKFDTISPSFIQKHSLYNNLSRTPSSHRFPTAIDYSPLLNAIIKDKQRYKYKSCFMPSDDAVNIVLKHWNVGRVEYKDMEIMPDGLPVNVTKKLSVISEKDFGDIQILFLLADNV